MKFDVVCGNPPYNNDMYLDFVMKGHELSKSYDLWITPAKFMLGRSKKNNLFRENILPFIREIVHYQNEADIFNIVMPCGVCYYLVDKKEHKDKYVTNESIAVPSFNTDRTLYKNFTVNEPLLSIGRDIVRKLDLSNILTTDVNNNTYMVSSTKMIRGFYLGGSDTRVYSATPVTRPLKLHPDEMVGENARILFSSSSRSECLSYMSYVETKLVRFLILLSATGYAFGKDFIYNFVPDPVSFDKIYEDKPLMGYTPDENGEYIDADGNKHCSLYVKYKLTDEEINIVESVIRERK